MSASSCSFLSPVSLPLFPPYLVFLCIIQPAVSTVPPRFLTSGSWDVTALCALDEMAGKMYVKATVCVMWGEGLWRMVRGVGGGKSPPSALNGSRLLLLKAQVAGDREVLTVTMSICEFAVGQEQSQRQINLWEQLNGHDSFKDDWGATFLHVVLISAERLKEIALAPTLLVAMRCHWDGAQIVYTWPKQIIAYICLYSTGWQKD